MPFKNVWIGVLLVLPLAGADRWTLPLFTTDARTVLAEAAKYAAPEDASGIILDRTFEATIDDAGRLQQTTRWVARIQRVQGIDVARRISIPYVVWRENRPSLKIRVITSDGQSHPLTDASVDEAGAQSTPEMKVLTAVLPDVNVDSVIECEMVQSDREPGFPGGRIGQFTLSSAFPILNLHVALTAPRGRILHAEVRGFSGPFSQVSPDPQHFVLDASNVWPNRIQLLLPPDLPAGPSITFTDVPSWQAVAEWYSKLIATALGDAPAAASTPPANPAAAVESTLETLRKEVHPENTPVGLQPYTPKAPAETLRSKKGNSADMALLLVSRLAHAGITANMALILANGKEDILPAVPGIELFDHALVYVPGAHPLWIDSAAEFTAAGRLPVYEQGRWALVLDPQTKDLIRTPESSAADNVENVAAEIRLRDGAPDHVTATIEARGAFEDSLRPMLQPLRTGSDSEKQGVQTEFTRLFHAERITNIDAGQPEDVAAPSTAKIVAEGYTASAVTEDGGYVDVLGPGGVNLQGLTQLFRVRDAASGRKADYFVPPLFTEQYRYRIVPPPGFEIKKIAPIPPLTIGPLSIASTVQLGPDGSLELTHKFVNSKLRYTPQEVMAMQRDASKLAAQAVIRVALSNTAEAKFANGEVKEAIALLRQSAQSDPANINAQLRLISAYVNLGFKSTGVELCQNLVAKHPDSGAAYARLGWVYSHDTFGRAFRAGADYSAAEKAYLKALQLGDDPAWAYQLATFYTFNPSGVRFGPGSHPDSAVAWYRRIGFSRLAQLGAVNDFPTALLFMRQYDQVRQFFLYPEADSANPALKLAAIAGMSGVGDALQEVQFTIEPAKQKIALAEAGKYLLSAREYGLAAALFRAAGVNVPVLAGIGVDRIAKAKPFDESAVSKQPAIAAAQHTAAALLNSSDPEKWSTFMTPEARQMSADQHRFALLQVLLGDQARLMQAQTWPNIGDVFLTTSTFTVDGDDQTGYRVQFSDGAAKASARSFAYVVKHGAEYLVAQIPAADSPQAQAAILLEQGKVTEALPILDTLRTRTPASAWITAAYAQTLMDAGQVDRASQFIEQLSPSQNTPQTFMRLRAHLLAEEGKFHDSKVLEEQICAAPNASAGDWNDLAWVDLFAGADDQPMLQAATKAAELTGYRNPAILHTLAVVQAATGDVRDAHASALRLMDAGGTDDELYSIFGRIAEQIDMPAAAADYYGRVGKPEGAPALSTYAFAQMRLKQLRLPSAVQDAAGAKPAH